MIAAALPCLAAEGFFSDNAPPAVRSVWPAVYEFVCQRGRSSYVATAFLVRQEPRGKRAAYYFMTAGHAVEDCKFPRRSLAEDINQPPFESDGITLARPPQRFEDVEFVYVDDAYDLAVIKAEAAAGLGIGAPLAVSCSQARQGEIYAVGFPSVRKRPSLRMRRERKRWSRGELAGLGKAEFRGQTSTYIATSIDSLPGSSGGPAVDQSGALVGVVAKGVAGSDNAFRYDVDPKNPRDWQTFLVPCQEVVRILEKDGLR